MRLDLDFSFLGADFEPIKVGNDAPIVDFSNTGWDSQMFPDENIQSLHHISHSTSQPNSYVFLPFKGGFTSLLLNKNIGSNSISQVLKSMLWVFYHQEAQLYQLITSLMEDCRRTDN